METLLFDPPYYGAGKRITEPAKIRKLETVQDDGAGFNFFAGVMSGGDADAGVRV